MTTGMATAEHAAAPLADRLLKADGNARAAGPATAFTGPELGTKDPKTAAEGMAGLFYSMMLTEMEKSVPKSDYMGGKGEETFRSLWVNECGRQMASRPGDPLTAAVLKSIQKATGANAYEGGKKA